MQGHAPSQLPYALLPSQKNSSAQSAAHSMGYPLFFNKSTFIHNRLDSQCLHSKLKTVGMDYEVKNVPLRDSVTSPTAPIQIIGSAHFLRANSSRVVKVNQQKLNQLSTFNARVTSYRIVVINVNTILTITRLKVST